MANIKSSIKRIRTNEIRRQKNVGVKSRMKTFVRQAMDAIETKDADKVKAALPLALREIDEAAAKGVIHRNSAARKKSSLERRAAALARP